MKTFRFTALIFTMVFVNNAMSQLKYTDLYFAELKGNVKSASVTNISFDTTSFFYGFDTKIISEYNHNGSCTFETEYRGLHIIQTSILILETVRGKEKMIKKITTDAVDSASKVIQYYISDETGFDTSIVVCRLDSSYYMLYKHKKNEFGLRSYGAEYNALNGNKNYSYEIAYSKDTILDSITYKDRFDKVKYTAHYQYNKSGLVDVVNYSDGGFTKFNYIKFDHIGNWTEQEIYYVNTGVSEKISKIIRVIKYY
jgi:hypothetical protein